jgi:hypothetical protein
MASIATSGTKTPAFGTFTVTIASPAGFTFTSHGLAVGDCVSFSTTGALPTGLTAGTTYYVIASGLTTNAFEVSTTSGGSAVNTSGSQSGTQTMIPEHTLFTSSATSPHFFYVSLRNMQAGDLVALAVYREVISTSGVFDQLYQGEFINAQIAQATATPPRAAVAGQATVCIPAETAVAGSMLFTLSQFGGTARAFDYSIETIP